MNRRFMNTMVKIALTTVLAVSAHTSITAQDYVTTPVTVSKEKVRVNGNICYSHIVREKQTLYSIAKAYEVSVEDIYTFNPSLKDTGLKKNAIILIPSKETLEKQATKEPAKETVQEPAKEPAKETVQETAKEPTKEVTKEAEPQEKQKTHVVKWYEDLDVIAEKYGVTVDALMKVNNLSGRKLEKRQKLIIPKPGEIFETPAANISDQKNEVEEELTSEITEVTDTVIVEDTSSDELIAQETFEPKEEIKVTLILPMKSLEENVSKNNLDFYNGVLLAVRDLAETGVGTELNVYDSSDSSYPIASEDIESSDFVIGPVSTGDLGRLLSNTPSPKFVISPLDPRAESIADTCTRFIHAPTPHKTQYADILRWMSEDTMPGDSLIIISEKGARQTDPIKQMNEMVDSSRLAFKTFSYSILEGRDVIEPISKLMTETDTNRVLIVSESEAFVNDVVRNLNILIHQKRNIVLYAPARIRGFETIEVENLHNTSLHVSLGYHIDYENPQIKNFLLKYRALFNTEPSQFAYQGYDIATYFISLCNRYGDNWYKKIESENRSMLQSDFSFKKKTEGGYVNKGVRRIVYGKDWSVR